MHGDLEPCDINYYASVCLTTYNEKTLPKCDLHMIVRWQCLARFSKISLR